MSSFRSTLLWLVALLVVVALAVLLLRFIIGTILFGIRIGAAIVVVVALGYIGYRVWRAWHRPRNF